MKKTLAELDRATIVWKLWLRMPCPASDAQWEKFNAVIFRRYGPPAPLSAKSYGRI